MTLIFCVHYFLWYGAHTTIFGYESVYAIHYTNASTVQFGTLKMILPFISVVATPIICSLADRRRTHRLYFTLSLLLATLSMVAFCLLPLSMSVDTTGTGEKIYKWFGSNLREQGSSPDLLIGPFAYFCVVSLVFELSLAVNTCLSDSFAVLQAEESGSNFGRIIVWGTFGWAAAALVLSLINQIGSFPRLLPGVLFGTVLLGVDMLVVSLWPNGADFKLDLIPMDAAMTLTGSSSSGHKDPIDYLQLNESAKQQQHKAKEQEDANVTTSFKTQMRLLGLLLSRRKSLLRFLLLFVCSGFLMSMHWNYFFLYLQHICRERFELISALSMVFQSLLGELPFFILSRKIIDLIGRSYTVSLSLVSIGIRFLLYRYLLPNASIYFIFVADCFQGPNYGLFYVLMTEVGLEYSHCDEDSIEHLVLHGSVDRNNRRQLDALRQALRSTLQSVAFACYEGLGVGLGSLVGGLVISYDHDFDFLWLSTGLFAIAVGVVNILVEIWFPDLDGDLQVEPSDLNEFNEAKRSGTLHRVASPSELPTPVSPIPLGPIKFQESLDSKLKRLIESRAAV